VDHLDGSSGARQNFVVSSEFSSNGKDQCGPKSLSLAKQAPADRFVEPNGFSFAGRYKLFEFVVQEGTDLAKEIIDFGHEMKNYRCRTASVQAATENAFLR
jgi:hypothetical protein